MCTKKSTEMRAVGTAVCPNCGTQFCILQIPPNPPIEKQSDKTDEAKVEYFLWNGNRCSRCGGCVDDGDICPCGIDYSRNPPVALRG